MELAEINKRAEEIAKKYNPEGLSPFPFERIEEDIDNLEIFLIELQPGILGAISFDPEENLYSVIIDKERTATKQHFILAHELGHYFLHRDYVRRHELLVDNDDALSWNKPLPDAERQQMETETNHFAAALLMPTELVVKAWNALHSVEECARIFNVSPTAMSIRLETLGLLT
ncbi:MAG TPA: ImmA/IrrE family metallo-endopeptidase [Patescibacteria group bacterium]|nr:ImmA/IrrE family metallo-endopeptidase [Patescibacteria group bacterium]